MLLRKTSLTINAIRVKAANISESKSKNTTDYHRHTDTLCCLNSVELYLHVTASKIQLIVHTFLKLVYNSDTYMLYKLSKSILQYIPHIKLQMDAEVSLWTKKWTACYFPSQQYCQ